MVTYRPLDMSFMKMKYSPQRENIANTAHAILANAGWGDEPTFAEMAQAQKAAKAAKAEHKVSFLSGLFDALQTPLYGVANALDEAVAGHQSDNNDSVVEDTGKFIGGLFTGGAKGIGAGLRGATSMLDVLPGVDINDDWQSDPTDKTHFSDVALRQNVGMSTKDAMKPENWDKVKGKLEDINKKSLWSKTFSQLFVPDNLNADDAREKYFRNNALAGIASDIGGDPLNFVTLPLKGASVAKDVVEGLDAAKAATNTTDAIKGGLDLKNLQHFEGKAPLGEAPIKAIEETLKATPKVAEAPTVAQKVISAIPETAKGYEGYKSLATIGRRSISKAGLRVSRHDQKGLVSEITTLAGHGQNTWRYKAADALRRHPEVKWTKTEAFLEKADEHVKKLGIKHNPGAMGPALAERIASDVEASRGAATIERRLMNKLGKTGEAGVKVAEAQLANKVVRKFEAEILHTKGASGTGPALARAISEGRNVRYSAPQQARMWNQITSSLKYANPKKFDKAVRILRSVENYFISKGAIPHSAWKTGESVPLRLSQVAEAIGPQFLGKTHALITGILKGDPKALAQLSSEQIAAIDALRAGEAVAVAPAVQKGIEAGKGAIEDLIKAPFSAGRKNGLFDSAVKAAKLHTAQLGGGDVGAKVAGEYLGNLLGKSDPINAALGANRLKTEAWLAKGALKGSKLANEPDFVKSVTDAISKASDLPNSAKLGGVFGAKALVADWLGARFNAAYGVKDMRQTFLREQAGAMETTARRARVINNLGRRFDPKDIDLWHEAFRTAQQNGIADGRVAELQAEIAKVMENLFGGSGLRSGAIADSTVVGRSRLLVDELNKNLKRFGLPKYSFEAKKVKDAAGVEHDFSKGMDWMRSWEAWEVKDPYTFLHKVQNAIEHTVREKNMLDEIVTRFASPNKLGAVKYGVAHPRFAGHFFTAEGAKQAKQFVHILDEVSTPNSKSMQHIDHVMSKIKASLTIYIPGHHMTNLIGDTYYNWIAGVNKPIRYEQAMKTMLAQKGRYGEFAEIGKRGGASSFEALAGPEALKQAVARSMVKPDAGLAIPAKGNAVVITMQNGTKVTADMIYTAAFKQGILPSARVLEDVTSEATSVIDKFRPLGGRGQRAVHQVSEVRDHIPRLAQFIDGIAKHKGSFEAAIEQSSRSVRKWHPDGLDLTNFEKRAMKRIFPFYSWTRKAIPLAIESAIFAGPKVMAYPRVMEAIALANGVDQQQSVTDPFPNDQMFPDWLRERGIGPIFGGPGSYGVVNPSTPVLDTFSLMGHPGQGAIDMMNPLIKVPIETMQDQTLGQKIPITNYWDYAAKQVPVVSQAGRASGQFGVSSSTKSEGFPNYTNILNLLTGAKKVDTGKYQKSSQFDLRDYLKAKAQQQGR